MSRKPLARLALGAALLVMGMSAPAAFAETETLTARVRYDDLDLTRQAGIDKLVQRLNQAAEMVCPSFPQGRFRVSVQAQACRREAIRQAVSDIGSPQLTMRLDPIRPYRLASR